ncbi:metallophosphoesterase [Alkalihalobacillus sp. AL-G]|uniref:metallophosphoesterase family protein n=1 Tax=Alkalihalobacillus sp. AL-G TaxID=2926399 RepID=UPI00272C8DD6|nr:metallophosphoesterase [Alkalihalobacillus sp. AL-G]WLD93923.1 metallophosphatase family protein [Alkalihalobacillus sp. AL-G]
MEQIAVISDVHGNIPALEAVLNDIERRGIERIICLGDMVGKGPCSELAVDIVREGCEVVVRGNWDDSITKPAETEVGTYYQNQLGQDRLDYLKTLPYSVQFWMSVRFVRLYHASQESVYTRIHPSHPHETRHAMFENTDATGEGPNGIEPDVVGYGDIHNAYIQHLRIGSVGNPLERTDASYAILEGDYGDDRPGMFNVQLVRVPYDIELAVAQAIERKVPELEYYLVELRTGVYRRSQKKLAHQ